MFKWIEILGKAVVSFLDLLGWIASLATHVLVHWPLAKWDTRAIAEQLERVGVQSVFMVSVISAFTGMVMAVQTLDQFLRFGASRYIGGVIALSMVREMSPVLTGIVVAGRVGSSMAAEIGTMKVTEQLDALRAFGLDEYVFVGLPRILASLIMVPILTIYSMVVGTFGGYLYVAVRGVHSLMFRDSIRILVSTYDINGGLIKSLVFGFVIAIVACACGFRAQGGAKGVGETTTLAVVWSNMFILILNYMLSTVLFGGRV